MAVATGCIHATGLTKAYRLYDSPMDRLKESLHPFKKKYHSLFYALHDLNLEVRPGEAVGIIGKNGAGKSTLLKLLTGVTTPTAGSLEIGGTISALLELGAGFNPELSGRANIFFSAAVLGITREEITPKVPSIIAFADIGEFIDQPVKHYSSGMYVRLAFSVAIHVDPDILIVDEALSVGDIRFQQKCLREIGEFQKQGKTIIFVSHDMSSILTFCDRVLWLMDGKVFRQGAPKDIVKQYISYMSYDVLPEDASDAATGTAETLPPEKGTGGDLQAAPPKATSAQAGKTENGALSSPPAPGQPDAQAVSRTNPAPASREAADAVAAGTDLPPDQGQPDLSLLDSTDGFSGFGEGGGRIERVGLFHAGTRDRVGAIGGGETLELVALARIDRPFARPLFGFSVTDDKGNPITGSNTAVAGVELAPFAAGIRMLLRVRFVFPRLRVGDYLFSVALGDGGYEKHQLAHWVYDACVVQLVSQELAARVGHLVLLQEAIFSVWDIDPSGMILERQA